MEPPDHLQGQGAGSVEDLVNPVQATDHGFEILGSKALLFHPELDGLNRVGQSEREVLRLIRFDQGREDVEPFPFRTALLGIRSIHNWGSLRGPRSRLRVPPGRLGARKHLV